MKDRRWSMWARLKGSFARPRSAQTVLQQLAVRLQLLAMRLPRAQPCPLDSRDVRQDQQPRCRAPPLLVHTNGEASS